MWHLLRSLLVVAALLDALQPSAGQIDPYYNQNQQQQQQQNPQFPTQQQWGNSPQTNQYGNQYGGLDSNFPQTNQFGNNLNNPQTNPNDRPPYRTDAGSYNDLTDQDEYGKRQQGGVGFRRRSPA